MALITWILNCCLSDDLHSREFGLLTDKYHVLGCLCYIWKCLFFLRPSQAYKDIIVSFDQCSCFYPSFLLSDTVSSASLHRLTGSWDQVQSMLQITRRKTTEQAITTADPLKVWTWEPNKMCFHLAFGELCFLEQNKFFSLLTCVREGPVYEAWVMH